MPEVHEVDYERGIENMYLVCSGKEQEQLKRLLSVEEGGDVRFIVDASTNEKVPLVAGETFTYDIKKEDSHAHYALFETISAVVACDGLDSMDIYEVEVSGELEIHSIYGCYTYIENVEVVGKISFRDVLKKVMRDINDGKLRDSFIDTAHDGIMNIEVNDHSVSFVKEFDSNGYKVAVATGDSSSAVGVCDNASSVTYGSYSVSSAVGLDVDAVSVGVGSVASACGAQESSRTYGTGSVACASGEGRSIAHAIAMQSIAVAKGNRGFSSSYAVTEDRRSIAIASGYKCRAVAKGGSSIALADGLNSAAKGVLGSYLVLTEYFSEEQDSLIGVKVVEVDGLKIKPMVFYSLEKGEVVECKD